MADSWCRLRRQDDGATLVLDGVVGFRVVDDVAVTEYPVEDGADPADHAQERARLVVLDVEVSESPVADDVDTDGPDRVAEVLDFLQESVGRPLTLTTLDRPTYRDLLTMSRGSPDYAPDRYAARLTIPLRQTRIVASRTVAVDLAPSAAADPVVDGADEADRGETGPGQEKSLAAGGSDLLGAALGALTGAN